MKKFILFSLFVLTSVSGFTQNDSLKVNNIDSLKVNRNYLPRFNSMFIELGGVAAYYSLNFEESIYLIDNFGLSVGIGFSPWFWDNKFLPRLPISAKLFYQIQKHTIEVGASSVFYRSYTSSVFHGIRRGYSIESYFISQIGYKYSILRDRFFIGIAYTPFPEDDIFHWGALRFGYKF